MLIVRYENILFVETINAGYSSCYSIRRTNVNTIEYDDGRYKIWNVLVRSFMRCICVFLEYDRIVDDEHKKLLKNENDPSESQFIKDNVMQVLVAFQKK